MQPLSQTTRSSQSDVGQLAAWLIMAPVVSFVGTTAALPTQS